MTSRSQFEIAVLRSRYLRSEYEYCLDVFERAKASLEKEILRLHKDLNVYDKEIDQIYNLGEPMHSKIKDKSACPDSEISDEEIREVSKNTESIPPWAKKIYRKIVMASHPDKLSKDISQKDADKLLGIYEKAVEAYSDSNYSSLINIAISMDISLEDQGPEATALIQEECNDLEKKITEIRSSSSWIWFHADGDAQKEMMSEFMRQRGWGSRESMRTRSRKGSGRHPGKSVKWIKDKLKNKQG